MLIRPMLLAIPVALALHGVASAAPVSSAACLSAPDAGLVQARWGHGHHYGWGRARGRHYGWYRGRHLGWYKHHRHRRYW